MNREIKFRAWHSLNNEMVYPKLGSNFGYGAYTNSDILKDYGPEDTMQYTGLKDKNGKEIYEGDIIIAYNFLHVGFKDSGIPDSPYEVFEDVKGFVVGDGGGYFFNDEYEIPVFSCDLSTVEVIGNIYENPEMMTKESTKQRSVANVDATSTDDDKQK